MLYNIQDYLHVQNYAIKTEVRKKKKSNIVGFPFDENSNKVILLLPLVLACYVVKVRRLSLINVHTWYPLHISKTFTLHFSQRTL